MLARERTVKDFLWFNLIIQSVSSVGRPHAEHLGSDERSYQHQMIIKMKPSTYRHKVVLLQPHHVPDLHVHPLGLLEAEERTAVFTKEALLTRLWPVNPSSVPPACIQALLALKTLNGSNHRFDKQNIKL